MSRALGSANLAEVNAGLVRPALFVELMFDEAPVRCWSGAGSITVFGNEFLGVGQFGGLSPVRESGDSPAGLELTLSGVPPDLVAVALAGTYQGRRARVWVGFFNASGALVATPYQIFGGRMDTLTTTCDGATATISVQCENLMIDLNRSRTSRWTDDEQQRLFPGDRACEFVSKLAERPINWGVAPPASASQGPVYAGPADVVIARPRR